jgi:hypothetical protein
MDVDDHDAAVARVSHLPHLMSVLVAGTDRVPNLTCMLAVKACAMSLVSPAATPCCGSRFVGRTRTRCSRSSAVSKISSVVDQGRGGRAGYDELRSSWSAALPAPRRSAASMGRQPSVTARSSSPFLTRRERWHDSLPTSALRGERGRHLHRARPGPRNWLSRLSVTPDTRMRWSRRCCRVAGQSPNKRPVR